MMGVRGKVTVTLPDTEGDSLWLRDLWVNEWGGDAMISKGRSYTLEDLDVLIAWVDGIRVGAATYHRTMDECELMSINAMVENAGVGSALISAVEETAKTAGVRRIWLITSNDNLDALRFYQRRGYRIVAVYPNAVDEARKLKSTIPEMGYYDIPIHDELELEKLL